VVNGGLGPTSDDISAEAASYAAEKPLELYTEWIERLETFFRTRGIPMPESNRKQAMLPQSSIILDNPIGTACGFKLTFNQCDFYFTPGVPKEFKLMVEQQILPDLKEHYRDITGQDCSKLYTFGTSESALSDTLDKVILPDGYSLGYRSYLPYIEVKLFGPKNDLDNRIKVLQIVYKLIESSVVSVDESMQDHVAFLIQERQLSIATAEQSTYGALSQWLQSKEIAAQYCGHGWVLGENISVGGEGDNPLAACFALAGATKEKCATDIAIVTGKVENNTFTIALAAPEGEWGQTLTFNRQYSREDRTVIITAIAGDVLRRYFNSKPMFGQYSSVTREKEMFVPRGALSDSSSH